MNIEYNKRNMYLKNIPINKKSEKYYIKVMIEHKICS